MGIHSVLAASQHVHGNGLVVGNGGRQIDAGIAAPQVGAILKRLGAAVILHLYHGGDGVAAIVVQLGVLVQDPLGVLRQVDVLLAQGADAQCAANLDHRVKRRTADAVVQCAVDGGQRNANCKSKLPDALVLAGNFFEVAIIFLFTVIISYFYNFYSFNFNPNIFTIVICGYRVFMWFKY